MEYGVRIIGAMEKNQPFSANLNVMNNGLIPTLPPGACVEVPCLVDGGGIFPGRIDDYPEQLAALNRGRDAAPFLLVLDGVEDPHNLGSILRVAECAGVDGVIIPARRSASVNATVIRVSAGAAAHVKVAKVGNVNDAIRRLKEEFFKVYCADMGGESMYDADFSGAIALVIGGEGSGVSRLTAKLCDKALSIPQFGKVNSLNASVACGVLCYEAIRARGGKK